MCVLPPASPILQVIHLEVRLLQVIILQIGILQVKFLQNGLHTYH